MFHNRNMEFDDINEALPELMNTVMKDGAVVGSRGGKTRELLFPSITLMYPRNREITNPVRRAHLPAQIAETMWVLAGRNDVDWLKNYLPRAPDFSDDGKTWRGGYGPSLRNWDGHDQLKHVVNLLKWDPETRRAVITLYNPERDGDPGKDIPCNNWLHFMQRNGYLHLHVAIRSNDLMWGWSGINAFEWSVLLEIVAGLTNMQMGTLKFSISSLHLYEQHWEKAQKIVKSPVPEHVELPQSPRFQKPEGVEFDSIIERWFMIEELIRKGKRNEIVDYEIDNFPEPMMGSWLVVLRWWWGARLEDDLLSIKGTPLERAARLTPGKPVPQTVPTPENDFEEFVLNLHREKNAVYGDSWKRRGEQIGIMANIARKVDRLAVAGAGDSAADTVIDLLVYLAKYRLWLTEYQGANLGTDIRGDSNHSRLTVDVEPVERLLKKYFEMNDPRNALEEVPAYLSSFFNDLEYLVTTYQDGDKAVSSKVSIIHDMMVMATPLARHLWNEEQK